MGVGFKSKLQKPQSKTLAAVIDAFFLCFADTPVVNPKFSEGIGDLGEAARSIRAEALKER